MKFSKRDLYFSIATGIITGFSAWRIFDYLKITTYHGYSWAWLIVIIPVFWIISVNFGYFLGRWISFFNQFGKFAAIGFTNASIDFGVLNLLIFLTGTAGGLWYAVFKGISFVCAVIPSYFWNKYWAFGATKTEGRGSEFFKFISVALVAIVVNDLAATGVVNFIHPIFGLNPQAWANIGAVAGSAAALIFSFVGFKKAVFKK